ncbi:dicarboxylate/amino acid:cation symporter [Clostridium pasteurianum]|uniref:dicarboxylate/amino acid:cation symporter n=1 Tax=Clostridium pasteurianum TaxID=1501 RepID=UPI002260D5D8|nr:dicarboxylate/amino acid:cation symporter [Clostridium pasteurianum]UZW14156.1 dicarboxylate/amino acid:cation symporter [Clostridium pasteurianum]
MKKISIVKLIVLAMILGIIGGILIGKPIGNIKFLGDIFLRLIQMSVVILIMGAVIEAVGSLDPDELGRLGSKTLIGFLVTTVIAAAVGIILANVISPGSGITGMNNLHSDVKLVNQSFADIIVNFFPKNIMESLSSGNTIQVIVFAILFGLALSILGKKEGNNAILNFVKQVNITLTYVIQIVMKSAPIGIFALIAWVVGTTGIKVIVPLAKFLLAMGIGTVGIIIVTILITALYAKISPIRLATKFYRMGIVAFTTTSSAVTLPVEMEDAENKMGINKRVSRLVLPLGMSLNSGGLALYLALACLTVSQFFNINLSMPQQITVVVMSTLATLGTVVVPGGGLVALAIVFPTMGLPMEGIALLAGIDWFSGIFRTVLNVFNDVIVAFFIAVNENEFDRETFISTK